MKPGAFNVKTVPRRLAALRSDPWKAFRRTSQTLTVAMKRSLEIAP